jgi:ubiquinone/menaquinone biosynthesis C-methylase UbiE
MMTGTETKNMAKLTKPVDDDFVKQYVDTRKKEQRLYKDEEVRKLPNISPSHPLYKEWQIRKISAKRLVGHLRKRAGTLKILEVGCGNGWLAAAMANRPNTEVLGIDINYVELNQAKRVFHELKTLKFSCTGIEDEILKQSPFDVIVFAASIQYFASITLAIKAAQLLLSAQGEIHILDTHFYPAKDVEDAKVRTNEYYTTLGYPKMSGYYHHHSLADLSDFNCSLLYSPSFFQRKILRNPSPFYWIKIEGKK